nr:phage antirepressor N-terminal domain-containing protein [Volucribacter psittacicida]
METLKEEFLGQQITLVDDNGVAYVAMREIVEGIGLDWKSQHRKLIDQSSKFSFTHITTTGKTEKDIKNSVCLFQN